MPGPVEVVVFDVNETLSDLSPMAARFEAIGVPGSLLQTWFASVLRDGFALACHDTARPFREVGAEVLRAILTGRELTVPLADAVDDVLDGFSQLDVHPDVPEGLRRLRERGLRVATFSNGASQVAQALLERAGLTDLVEQVLSVEQAGRWKPHPRSYAWAAEQLGADPGRLALVAVHPWDVDGATRSGWTGAWLDRAGTPYPEVFLPPAVTARDLPLLVGQL